MTGEGPKRDRARRVVSTAVASLAALALLTPAACGGGGGGEAVASGVAFARGPVGQRDVWTVALEGGAPTPVSALPGDEYPVAYVAGGGLITQVATGDLWTVLLHPDEGGELGAAPAVPLAGGLAVRGVARVQDFLLILALRAGEGTERRDLYAADWRRPAEPPLDLFPDSTSETFRGLTRDGWVIAEVASGLVAAIADPTRARAVGLAPAGASFLAVLNDGRVLYQQGGRLWAVSPSSGVRRAVPDRGGEPFFVGVTPGDSVLFREEGRLWTARPGDTEAVATGAELPDEAGIVALEGGWLFLRDGEVLRSTTLDGERAGVLPVRASQLIRIVFLGLDRILVADAEPRILTVDRDGSDPFLVSGDGRLIAVVEVPGPGVLLELERGEQRDLELVPGDRSAPVPIAATGEREGRAVLVP